MELKIGQKVEKKFKSCYVLSHNYMIGDADGDYSFTNVISENNPFLKAYIEKLENFIEEIDGVYADDVSFTFDEFYETLDKNVENYDEFFEEIEFEEKTETDLGWHSYEGYSISYFDENGDEFEVEIQR
jgi:hypothetical protein